MIRNSVLSSLNNFKNSSKSLWVFTFRHLGDFTTEILNDENAFISSEMRRIVPRFFIGVLLKDTQYSFHASHIF